MKLYEPKHFLFKNGFSYSSILFFSLFIPISAEFINSAIERVVDLVTNGYHLLAKQAKDTGATLVLVSLILTSLIASQRPKVALVLSGKSPQEIEDILSLADWKSFITNDFNRQDIPMKRKNATENFDRNDLRKSVTVYVVTDTFLAPFYLGEKF